MSKIIFVSICFSICFISLFSMPMEPGVPQVPFPEDLVSQVPVEPESFGQPEMQIGLPAFPEELEINKQKQELELLKVDVDNIEQQEETLMARLRELEDQINFAQTQAVSARKTKQQILGAQTVEQASGLLNQLNMIFNQIQAIQTKLQGQFSQEFNNIVMQIQNQIQLVQVKANEITARSTSVVQQVPEVAIVVKKKVELESGIAKKIADFFAFIISLFSDLVNWFKGLLVLPKQASTVSVEMQSIPPIPEFPPQLGVPPMPVDQQMAPLSSDVLSRKFNEQMESYNNVIQKLKAKKIKIKKEEMEIEKKKKMLAELKQQKSALRKYQDLMKQLGFTVDVARAKKSGIRKDVEFAFGKVLDFGGYFLEKVGSVSIGIYEKILLPRLQNFTQAVKQRVEEDQEK